MQDQFNPAQGQQQFYGGYPGGQMPMPGYGYVNQGYGFSPVPKAKNTQPLTPEQVAKLRQGSTFDWRVSQEDVWKAICTHKDPTTGQPTIIDIGNGRWKCTICGAEFSMERRDDKDIQNAVSTIVDLLQTAKCMYLNASPALIENYFQIIPILEKFPTLWKKAMDDFSKYDPDSYAAMNPIYGNWGQNGFAMLNNMLIGNPMNYYGYGQVPPQQPGPWGPQMGTYPQAGYAPQGQPMPMGGQVAPGWAPQAQAWGPAPVGSNPIGYGAPVAPNPNVPPQMVQQAPVPGAPAAAEGEVVQNKQFNV